MKISRNWPNILSRKDAKGWKRERTPNSPKPTIKISALARTDLEEIHSYIAEDNETAADKIADELSKLLRLLAHNPRIGREWRDLMVNLRSFPFQRYII